MPRVEDRRRSHHVLPGSSLPWLSRSVAFPNSHACMRNYHRGAVPIHQAVSARRDTAAR